MKLKAVSGFIISVTVSLPATWRDLKSIRAKAAVCATGSSRLLHAFNEAVRCMYALDKDWGLNKDRTNGHKSHLSCQVALPVQISNLFLMDLRKLASIAV